MIPSKKKYQELFLLLVGTRSNVYDQCRKVFGLKYKWTDGDFDRLQKHTGLFRCEECGEWKDSSEGDRDVDSMCAECVNEMERDNVLKEDAE